MNLYIFVIRSTFNFSIITGVRFEKKGQTFFLQIKTATFKSQTQFPYLNSSWQQLPENCLEERIPFMSLNMEIELIDLTLQENYAVTGI